MKGSHYSPTMVIGVHEVVTSGATEVFDLKTEVGLIMMDQSSIQAY